LLTIFSPANLGIELPSITLHPNRKTFFPPKLKPQEIRSNDELEICKTIEKYYNDIIFCTENQLSSTSLDNLQDLSISLQTMQVNLDYSIESISQGDGCCCNVDNAIIFSRMVILSKQVDVLVVYIKSLIEKRNTKKTFAGRIVSTLHSLRGFLD
jgi:hypothetical protein